MTQALDFASLAPFAGKYQVVRVLGQGGMGTVFEARHVRTGHRVAIKVLGSSLVQFPELVRRFEREARACGALSSPNAVKVHDIDTTEDGTPYLIMELLAGSDLAGVIERGGPQPIGRASRWLLDACHAIEEAHALGIVHRDIKPSNLFIADVEGTPIVKVLDFGIAKVRETSPKNVSLTHAAAPLGTPQYMSPEQVRCAKDVDARTDVWSLGVTLYELVTGRTPYAECQESWAVIASVAADPVPDPQLFMPDLPDAFCDVIMKALEKKVEDRYPSVEAFAAALAPFADAVPAESARFRKIGNVETLPAPRASDASFPAAVSRITCAAPLKKRSSRGLALACAATLGLMALAIPTCVGSRHAATLGMATVPRPNVLVVPVVPTADAVKVESPVVPVVAEAPVAPEAKVEEVVTKPVVRAPQYQRPVPATQTLLAKKSRVADLTVHGGLSGPGL